MSPGAFSPRGLIQASRGHQPASALGFFAQNLETRARKESEG